MSAKKHAWTGPGTIEDGDPAESRKGTAAANPVLSLSPQSQASLRAAEGNGSNADHRSPAQIEADIEHTRDRLAVTLDELTERLTPRALMRRTNAKARGAFVTPQGSVRKDRAAIVAGSLVSVLSGVVALRMLRRR